MQRATSILRAARTLGKSNRAYGGGKFLTNKELDMRNKSLMDHLPQPSGSWQAGYKAKDVKANMFLATSLAVLVATVAYMENDGVFDMLQNPVNWSDKKIERQARYYAKGNKWRKSDDDDDDDE